MRTTFALLSAAAVIMVAAGVAKAKPARNHGSADARAAAALAKMTREDKVALLHGRMLMMEAKAKRPADITLGAGYVPGNPSLGVPPQVATDASLGVANLLESRKGDVATALPSGLALASSWNPDLLHEGGRMIGSEARAKGFNVMLAGGINLVRDPRAGRNFEYLGEDPLLAGRLVAAQIDGIQSNHIIATIKHFALNDQETGRATASVDMDEAAMRESDLLAFEIGIEGGKPGSVMCAYNRVGGIYACENDFLLNGVLRRDWGFKGYVMSDWGAVHSTEAILAGLDQQSGEKLDKKLWFSTELLTAVKEGRISESAIDKAAQRILRTIFEKGLAEHPIAVTPIDYETNGKIALRAAEEGIVLLKNEGGVLPLASTAKRIVVIGGHADIGVLSGGGSSQVVPVGGFRKTEAIKGGAAAAFARRSYGGTPPLDALRAAFPQSDIRFVDGLDQATAATAARDADVAIVFGEKFATEAEDQRDISLDGDQDRLIAAVAEVNPRTVVVLEIGNPVAMPWHGKAAAILAAWYPGQRGGDAIAGVLSGAVNPSGRLPLTFPASIEQLPNPKLPGSDLPPPSTEDKVTYGVNTNAPAFTIAYPEGSDAGYRWFDRSGAKPLFAFGHGLGYSSFRYDALRVTGGRTVSVTFTVTNTGGRAGADVPQVYVTLPGKAKRLVGWAKSQLAPGETKTVTVVADPRLLASFDAKKRRWIVGRGKVKVEVARSAIDPVLSASTVISGSSLKP